MGAGRLRDLQRCDFHKPDDPHQLGVSTRNHQKETVSDEHISGPRISIATDSSGREAGKSFKILACLRSLRRSLEQELQF